MAIHITTVRPEMAHSRTAKDWGDFLGKSAKNLGVAAKMYENHTLSYFTEGFGNVIRNKEQGGKFQKLNTMEFKWEIEVNQVKRVIFAADVNDAYKGGFGLDIPMAFTERYYEVNDTFMIDETHQLCIVVDGPIRKSDNFWEYSVRLVDADYAATLDVTGCKAGMTTRWIGNIQPEYHNFGSVKYTSNYNELHNWIGEIRVDSDASSRYVAMEDTFIKITKDDINGNKNYLFKMPGRQKLVIDTFHDAVNNMMMWGKSTMDERGKCTLHDRTGRELICGDGAIAQIERYASIYNYARLSTNVLTEAITELAQKCEESTGNHFALVCNDILFADLQRVCAEFLKNHQVDQQFMWSNYENSRIKVGATYGAFEWMNNVISFRPDRALTNEYPTKGYGILVDLTTDKASGMAPIQKFTLEGKEFVLNHLTGVGIKNGEVATGVAGETYIASGYAGIGIMNPYRTYILMQN
jgi:hypothetical protein